MQIIQFNVITEILFDFSQKYQTVPRLNRRASVFWNAIDFCRLYTVLLLKKSQYMWALPTVPLFAGKSRFFTRNVPLKTFFRLAGLNFVPDTGVRVTESMKRFSLSCMFSLATEDNLCHSLIALCTVSVRM